MIRGLLIMLVASSVLSAIGQSPATAPGCRSSNGISCDPAVSLLLHKASAERVEREIRFQVEVTLDNALGRDLAVRSNFGSVFDGLQLVVTTTEGRILAQQGYTLHQSPYTPPPGRDFPLKQGKTEKTLLFPIAGLPKDAPSLKIRLVGSLPGSGYERILSSETLVVEVKDRPR